MSDESQRTELVALATAIRNGAKLPTGYNTVIVVTDANGAWCGVSSTADTAYTERMLQSALHGAELKSHDEPVIGAEGVTVDGELS